MPDADPLEGEDPYGVLGVTEEDRLEKIEKKKDNLFNEWISKKTEAKREDNDDLFIKSTKAIKNINMAWAWIEENHAPLERVEDDRGGIDMRDPYTLLGVADSDSLEKIRERRNDLIRKHSENVTLDIYKEEPWRFNMSLMKISSIDAAWKYIESEHTQEEV